MKSNDRNRSGAGGAASGEKSVGKKTGAKVAAKVAAKAGGKDGARKQAAAAMAPEVRDELQRLVNEAVNEAADRVIKVLLDALGGDGGGQRIRMESVESTFSTGAAVLAVASIETKVLDAVASRTRYRFNISSTLGSLGFSTELQFAKLADTIKQFLSPRDFVLNGGDLKEDLELSALIDLVRERIEEAGK